MDHLDRDVEFNGRVVAPVRGQVASRPSSASRIPSSTNSHRAS